MINVSERYVPPHLRSRPGPPPPHGRGGYHDHGYNQQRDFQHREPYRGLFGYISFETISFRTQLSDGSNLNNCILQRESFQNLSCVVKRIWTFQQSISVTLQMITRLGKKFNSLIFFDWDI